MRALYCRASGTVCSSFTIVLCVFARDLTECALTMVSRSISGFIVPYAPMGFDSLSLTSVLFCFRFLASGCVPKSCSAASVWSIIAFGFHGLGFRGFAGLRVEISRVSRRFRGFQGDFGVPCIPQSPQSPPNPRPRLSVYKIRP